MTPPPEPLIGEPKQKKSSKKKNKNKNKHNNPNANANAYANDNDNVNANVNDNNNNDSNFPPSEFIPTSAGTTSWAEASHPNYNADADTVSNASFESTASRRRRRPRGGRKRKNKLHIVDEGQGLSPEEQARLEEGQLREAERQLTGEVDDSAPPSASLHASMQDEREEQEDYQGGAELQPETPPHAHSLNGVAEPPPEPKKFETGIKSFNVRKADPAGGRPVGTKIQTRGIGGQHQQQQPNQQQQPPHQHQQQQPHHQHHPRHRHQHQKSHQQPQTQPQQQQPQQQQQQPQQQQSQQQHHIPRISVQPQNTQQGQGNENKEVSIKLDLNIEVEILLKAKIKGEIMITFLN